MKVGDLKAECQARGISTEGNRKKLADLVVKARRANPSILSEILRARGLKIQQRKLQRLTQPEPEKEVPDSPDKRLSNRLL